MTTRNVFGRGPALLLGKAAWMLRKVLRGLETSGFRRSCPGIILLRFSLRTMSPVWRNDYRCWGGAQDVKHLVKRPVSRDEVLRALRCRNGSAALAFGSGRSLGDVALNPGGTLVDCGRLDRFISFDRDKGVLTCEAGVQLADVLAIVCRPESDGSGWFLPATPGTRFVTIGGALANDVHGKNHHRFGTFGQHILAFELARTDGRRQICSPTQNKELFAATIGGLGLTGIVLKVSLQLRRVPGLGLEGEDLQFGCLDEFFDLAQESDRHWEYTAAWVDCFAKGTGFGRGVLFRANHAPGVGASPPSRETRITVPFESPVSLVNGFGVRCFNALFWRQFGRKRRWVGKYSATLYPLDGIGKWNRLYGRKGYYQFQCVVPHEVKRLILPKLLKAVAASGEGAMFATLKIFGDLPSPGMLSFPMPGATLALDFPDRGESTRRLYSQLECLVCEAGGRLYPAKDRLMSAETFRRGCPQAEAFRAFIDPGMSSAFARRVGLV